MPVIKIEKIVSFSSEDPVHVANNILSNDPAKKWKCRSQGEKSASVVLQLEKACVISSVDIGNECSAYIEVLVNRSSTQDDFKVLLVMSSFMTPMEARQGLNLNKVRMFNRDQLSKPECDEKWDRVKIVCTQPFNRHMQYGLSFMSFHSPNEKEAPASTSTITKFVIRPDSPDNLTAGSLFARRKELQENTTLKAAAAIREATSLALNSKKSPSNKKNLKFYEQSSGEESQDNEGDAIAERNRNDLLYTKDEEKPNKKIDYIVEQKNKETKQKQEKVEAPKKKKESHKNEKETKNKAKQKNVSPRGQSSAKPTSTDSGKRKLTTNDTPNKKLKQSKLYKPFNQLLDGVIFVISGIQNPDRAILRTKAMSLGAKYKSDWDSSCTHLICAFSNTPKFNQVKGKGKIVTKDWINDCNSKRKRLPWRRYALDKNDKGKAESEDEICELTKQETKVHVPDSPASTSNSKNEKVPKTTPIAHKVQSESDIEKDDAGPSSRKANGTKDSDTEHDDSHDVQNGGTDTEDEIERIQNLQQDKTVKKLPDIFSVDTDEEETVKICGKNGNPSLPEFFTDKTFYIDPNFSNKEKALLVKYITAFNGTIKENLNGSVDIVISTSEHASALSSSSKADIVSPDFIWECHNRQKLLPVDEFKL